MMKSQPICLMLGQPKYGTTMPYPQIYRGDVEKTARSVLRSIHHE
jgi:hypothetical protein